MIDKDADFAWSVEHGPELFRKYSGQWIAVRDGKVVGVGPTATKAAEQAEEQCPDHDFILEAVDFDADVVYECARMASRPLGPEAIVAPSLGAHP